MHVRAHADFGLYGLLSTQKVRVMKRIKHAVRREDPTEAPLGMGRPPIHHCMPWDESLSLLVHSYVIESHVSPLDGLGVRR